MKDEAGAANAGAKIDPSRIDAFGGAMPAAAQALGAVGLAPDAYEAAFRSSPVAMALARDAHCAVVLRNAAMNRIIPASLDWRGWRLPDGSSPPLFENGVAVPLDRQPLRLAAYRGESTSGREIELRWPGRDPVFLSVSANPLFDATGTVCGAIASAVDITGAKQADTARRRGYEAGDARRPGPDASGRLKDDLLGLFGHELRNPMNAIATAVEVLNRADPAAPDSLAARRIIGRQTRRLAGLIGELGEIGRVLSDRVEPVRRTLDLGHLVEACTARAGARAEGKRQHLRHEFARVQVDADDRMLADALDRLLDDALQRAPEGAEIVVRLRRAIGPDGAEAVLEIGDADAFRLAGAAASDPTHSNVPGQGHGVSLLLVRHVVEQHGGRLEGRRTDPATGASAIALRLPAVGAASPAGARTAARVGVIDDSPDALFGLCALLEMAGHAVTTAEDGPTGVAMLLRDAPDIAIVDIGLPGFDGYEVARRSRAAGFRGRLVAISGYGHDVASPRSLAAGFEACLPKPVDSNRLARLIAAPAPFPGELP